MRSSVAKKGWVVVSRFCNEKCKEKNVTRWRGLTFDFHAFTDDTSVRTYNIINMHDLFFTWKYPRVMFRE